MWQVPSDITPPRDRQGLPPGGSPATDAEWLRWRDAFLSAAAERRVVRRWHDWDDGTERFSAWRFDRHVFAALSGTPLFDDPVIPRVRLRFLGVWLRDRRRAVLRAAGRFIDETTW